MTQDRYTPQGRELREHGTNAFPIAHYGGDWKQASVPLHWHSEWEAGFITAGQVTVCVGKDKTVLSQGDGFFINSGIPHAFLEAGDDLSCQRSIVFDPVLVGGRFDSVFYQRYVQPILSATSLPWLAFRPEEDWQKEAISTIETVWDHCQAPHGDWELEVRYGLSRLLAQLSHRLRAEHPIQARRIARDNQRIRTMMGYIQEHYREELTIADIAASALISPSECLRCFHSTLGMTPIQYTKYYRIQHAAAQLQSTDKKIAEIGESCGFQEMSYFARSFREILGMNPSEYRKKHRGTD